MAISDKLIELNNTKQNIKTAIINKGVDMDNVPFTSYAEMIDEITGGGEPAPEWQPHPDWYDIKQIYADDVQAGHTKRYIFLLSDSSNTVALSGGTAYKTSDGSFYTSSPVTHTWDRSKDKPCSDGYKTRWVIVYHTGDVSVNHRSIDSLWVYFGDCNISSLVFGASSGSQNMLVQSIETSDNTTGSSGAINVEAFRACQTLTSINIPYGVTSIGDNAFHQSYALTSINIPDGVTSISPYAFANCRTLTSINISNGVTSIGNYAFSYCSALKSINIPNSITSIGVDAFTDCYALLSATIPSNFNINSLNLSSSTYLSISSLENMINNLKDRTGDTAYTLTLGSTNIAKLDSGTIAIATNKNWTLA